MIKKLMYVGLILSISACSAQNPYFANNAKRSDFTADNASLIKKINLLNTDEEQGITRNLKKVTEEIVDGKNNIHQKTITIQEQLKIKDAVGNAEAVLVYDSVNKTRSGKRSITLSDDGSASLSQIVKNFEISKYKAIENDQFKTASEEVPVKNNITEDISDKKADNVKKEIPAKIIPSALPDVLSKNGSDKAPKNPNAIHAWLQ
jgi:hypothetical protein